MSMKRPVGFLLLVVGLLALFFETQIAVSSLFATWVLIWFVVSTTGGGSLLMGGLGLKTSLKSLLVALAFLLPFSLIFSILLRAPVPPLRWQCRSHLSAFYFTFIGTNVRHNNCVSLKMNTCKNKKKKGGHRISIRFSCLGLGQ